MALTTGNAMPLDPRDVGRPDKFLGQSADEWSEWAFAARPFIGLLGIFTPVQLKAAEVRTEPIILQQLNEDTQRRCQWLWFLLTQYFGKTAAKLMKNVEEGNGLEAWRKVARHCLAVDGASQSGQLDQITHFDFSGSFVEKLLDFDL